MSVMPDRWILECGEKLISPFISHQKKSGVLSYGLSSYGYDMRVDNNFKLFTNLHAGIVDPKNFNPKNFINIAADDFCVIPPNSFALASTVEHVCVPRNMVVICIGKSTYARCGIIINTTPLEPEWEGKITIEISNTTPLPAKIYVNEGICQCIFIKGDGNCITSYKDKKGKYMNQKGIKLPIVD